MSRINERVPPLVLRRAIDKLDSDVLVAAAGNRAGTSFDAATASGAAAMASHPQFGPGGCRGRGGLGHAVK